MDGAALSWDVARELALRWADDDPDPTTAEALLAVLAAAGAGDPTARADVVEQFSGRLRFGTAGLRAPLGWGPQRMNRVTVARAAAGLAGWLAQPAGSAGNHRAHVVVAHDARHGSARFARDSAEILAGAGHQVATLTGPVPTPLLAFALGHLGADAAVMVTASHNPASDNGYKVYVGRSQIAPPVDGEIAAAIDSGRGRPVTGLPRSDDISAAPLTLTADYVAATQALVTGLRRPDDTPRRLRLAVTALHGVGQDLLSAALAATGFDDVHPVAAQARPDPDFPTAPAPNPERPGALDLLLAHATAVDADLALALDPDADRCAVAIPTGSGSGAGWRRLSGDEVGDLLAHFLADRAGEGTFATTLVSGSRIAAIAAAAGRTHATTLTGFKWLSRVPGLAYAYEEAIGYCVDPAVVADKDGIAAGVVVALAAATWRGQGRSVADVLTDLDDRFGVDLTAQLVRPWPSSPPAVALATLDRLLAMEQLGGRPLTTVADLADGWAGLPATDGWLLAAGDVTAPGPDAAIRVVVRPSGTEPLVKAYLEVRAGPAGPERAAAQNLLDELTGQVAAWLDDIVTAVGGRAGRP
jgi:phosphomannomutase